MPRIPVTIVALYFLIGGVSHLINPDVFIAMMPDYLGYHSELVLISGVFEILGAIGILIPQTRLLACYGLLALIIAVSPAHIHMALYTERYPDIPELVLYLRIPLQFLFFWFVWWAIKPERLRTENKEQVS